VQGVANVGKVSETHGGIVTSGNSPQIISAGAMERAFQPLGRGCRVNRVIYGARSGGKCSAKGLRQPAVSG